MMRLLYFLPSLSQQRKYQYLFFILSLLHEVIHKTCDVKQDLDIRLCFVFAATVFGVFW